MSSFKKKNHKKIHKGADKNIITYGKTLNSHNVVNNLHHDTKKVMCYEYYNYIIRVPELSRASQAQEDWLFSCLSPSGYIISVWV